VAAGLLGVAAELREIPDPKFRATLRAYLQEQAALEGAMPGAKPAAVRKAPALAAKGRDVAVPFDILPTLFGAGYGAYPIRRSNFALSLVAHAAAMALLVSSSIWLAQHREKIPLVSATLMTDSSPYILPPSRDLSGGGGGGGDRDLLQASKGAPPRFAREQIAPPAVVVRNEEPKLPAEPTVVGPPNVSLAQTSQMGDPLSSVLGPPSNGTGSGGGIGNGVGGGVGGGSGPGVGPGQGGGIGGGIYRVGGGVSAPRPIYDPEPEYSEDARKAKFQGNVILQIVVGTDGRPRDLRVARSLGMGLDEKAIEAVRQWRFEPATKSGVPVAVVVNVEVTFRLY
jgi:protein TonB